MLLRTTTLVVVASTALTAWAIGNSAEQAERKCPGCPGSCAQSCGENCPDCPIEAAVKALPQLTYVVGEEQTSCPLTAEKLATDQGVAVSYLVGEENYSDKSAALLALLVATEKQLEDFTTPHTCSVSGTTTLAGKSMTCCHTADKYATAMKKAMQQVSLEYFVGDQKCCSRSAHTNAEITGKEITFVVGSEKTNCETTARINLARAKLRAAVSAMLEAEGEAQASTSSSDEGDLSKS